MVSSCLLFDQHGARSGSPQLQNNPHVSHYCSVNSLHQKHNGISVYLLLYRAAPTTTTQVPPATSACLSQVPIANMRMTTAAAPALSYKVSQAAAPPLCHAIQVSTASLSMADVISEWWRKTWCVWHALLAAGDLPVFLTQQLEALTVHNRYCDGCMVQPALPIQAATLLHQQKILLKHQMRLMNQQILNYQVYGMFLRLYMHVHAMCFVGVSECVVCTRVTVLGVWVVCVKLWACVRVCEWVYA